ncbi:MAG TPA: hypothetical protein VL358_08680 [Caulobacteraceae bacterium]|jgi:hypothetical protein|nr:hypothetical protein [Caulobacteraceae bacterium]
MKTGHRLLVAAAILGGLGLAHGQARAASVPDLAGVYFNPHPPKTLQIVGGGAPPLTAAGKAALAANAPEVAKSKVPPAGQHMEACLPDGPTRILQEPYPMEIVQKGDTVLLIWEHNHVNEQIYMNEKPDPQADWAYMGNSVGHWEGSTLVADTIQFNDMTFLDDNGLPHSENLKVQRRFRLLPGGKALEILATVTDPEMYTKPWTVRAVLPRRTDVHIEEFICGIRNWETRYTRAR